jgi:hypothetical protein
LGVFTHRIHALEMQSTKMKRSLAIMTAVAGFALLAPAHAAVKNVAWLQGTTLKNGTPVLNSIEPMGINWAAHSSIDPAVYDHRLVNSSMLTIRKAGDYLVAVTLPMKGKGVRSAQAIEVYVNGQVAPGAISRCAYIRAASGQEESSAHLASLLTGLKANDMIEVMTYKATHNKVPVEMETASLYVERVRDSRDVFSGTATEAVGGAMLNRAEGEAEPGELALVWKANRTGAAFGHSGETITLMDEGSYLVFVNVPLQGNVTHASVGLQLWLGGYEEGDLAIGGRAQQGYIRNVSNHDKSSIHFSGLIHTTQANQELVVETLQLANSGEITMGNKQASIYIEKVNTTSGLFFSSAFNLTDTDNWNPNKKDSVFWEAIEGPAIDKSRFGHSEEGGKEIVIRKDGSYLLVYNDVLEGGSARANPRITVEVNGKSVPGAQSKAHYIRNAGGHSASSASLVFLLENLKADDVLTVSAAQEGGGGEVYAQEDALLTLQHKETLTLPDGDTSPPRIIAFHQILKSPSGRPVNGFSLAIQDMGLKLDDASLKASLDGLAVKLKVSRDGDKLNVTFMENINLKTGHIWSQADISFSDTGGNSHEKVFFGKAPPTPPPFDETKTQLALPLPEPPVIDGVIDLDGGESWIWAGGAAGEWWRSEFDETMTDGIRGGAIGDKGTPPSDKQDLGIRVFAGYDADNFYIGVKVQDDNFFGDSAEEESQNGNTWHDDAVEIFIDGDNSNLDTRDTSGNNPDVVGTGGQFVITVNNAYREQEAGNPGYGEDEAWYALVTTGDGGYDAEFRISMDTIGNPNPGEVIGFTVGVNDDNDGGVRERQILWVGIPHTEATYGNLLLEGKTYTALKKAAPVIDGVIHTAEYAGAERTYVNPHNGIYDITVGDDSWDSSDQSFFAWVTHDYEAVYVAVDVTDPNVVTDSADAGTEDGQTWQDDSVEIFFDADDSNDAGRGTKGFEGQYVLTANGAWRDKEANNPKFGKAGDWFAATKRTGKGYQVEFKIKKSALSNPADGASLGFNIAINDDDGENGSRKAQLNWSGRAHSEFTYGRLILEEGEGGGPPPSISARLNDNGTVTLTFDGKLQTAPTVNGPWQDANATSPQIVPANQAAQFGRAVR